MTQTVAEAITETNHANVETGVRAALTFAREQDTRPVFIGAAVTGSDPEVRFEVEERIVPITDMRDIADTLSIDREGFELLRHATAAGDLHDDETVGDRYVPETEALLLDRFDANRVIVFDATRRAGDGIGAENRDGRRGPARRIHVDYTTTSGPQRFRDLVGDAEADRLFASGARILQVNVWRPIRGPVERSPLALADAGTIEAGDLVATDNVHPDRVGEIYHLRYSPTQRWYFAPRMGRDEVLLIKGWDSLDDARARFTPHTAFELPDGDPDAAPRESIELRTYVIIE